MGLVVLLVSAASEQVSLGPRSALALAELGVTSVSLVGGEETVGVVVEGWAFDPDRAAEAAAAVGASSAVALTSLVHLAVPTATSRGERDEDEAHAAGGGVAAGAR